jgi:hypothetical protein
MRKEALIGMFASNLILGAAIWLAATPATLADG